jgi:hypothetical protein
MSLDFLTVGVCSVGTTHDTSFGVTKDENPNSPRPDTLVTIHERVSSSAPMLILTAPLRRNPERPSPDTLRPGLVEQLRFSADGRWLAAAGRGSLVVYDVAS